MKEITNNIKWSAITLLLFLSGFSLGAQFIENEQNLLHIDWSLPLICWLSSWIIYEVTQLFNEPLPKNQVNPKTQLETQPVVRRQVPVHHDTHSQLFQEKRNHIIQE
ncbi:MAG: hypothetical protein ACWA5U_02820 [bacterium]